MDRKQIQAVISFVLATGYWFFRQSIGNFIYSQIANLAPSAADVQSIIKGFVEYGPPLVLVWFGIYLLLTHTSRKQHVSLMEAIIYAAFGVWDRSIDLTQDHEETGELQSAKKAIIQRAIDGDLPIWGKPVTGKAGSLEKIESAYWRQYDIDFGGASKRHPRKLRTKRTGRSLLPLRLYENLATSKEAVEQIWPSEITLTWMKRSGKGS